MCDTIVYVYVAQIDCVLEIAREDVRHDARYEVRERWREIEHVTVRGGQLRKCDVASISRQDTYI